MNVGPCASLRYVAITKPELAYFLYFSRILVLLVIYLLFVFLFIYCLLSMPINLFPPFRRALGPCFQNIPDNLETVFSKYP